MTIVSIISLVLLGLFAGSLSGLLGIGGGVILIPALVFLFGLTQHLAQGTTLTLMVPPIGLLAAITYFKRGYVNLKIAALICSGFAVGGFLGAKLANGLSGITLERVFGICLLLVVFQIFAMKDRKLTAANPIFHVQQNSAFSMALFILLGVMVGYLSGLIGIGGGIILVPALVFLFGMSQHEAQGTTLALMIPPIGLPAAIEYYQHGNVDLLMAGIICCSFVLGALAGARFAIYLPSHILSKIFGVFLIMIAIKMVFAS